MAHAREHDFDPLALQAPSGAFCRDFEHEGNLYYALLIRLRMPPGLHLPPELGSGPIPEGKSVYLLSVAKLNAVPDSIGRFLPTEEEGAEIAKAFCPTGCMALAQQSDLLKGTRKYFAVV